MSLVVALDDIKPDQVRPVRVTGMPGHSDATGTGTTFLKATRDTPDAPSASLNRFDPGSLHSAHYHAVDQFQIIVDGKGKFGRHDVAPYCVHFSRAYTPYGPLLSDEETGWAFLALRAHYGGAQRLFDKLKQMPDRRPWQVTKKITFPAQRPGISLQEVPEIHDDQGLFTYALTMAPHTRTAAPDPARGDGQYMVVVKGSLVHKDREHKALAVAFVKPDEDAFQLQAGPQGLEALILNFPQVKPRAPDLKTPSTAAGFKKWQCALCSFAYDEALGMPGDGIPAGTRWQDVPDTWSCPDCSARKSDFEMVEV